MKNYKEYELWFVTGSQSLYGEEALKQVASNAQAVARALDESEYLPLKVVYKPIVKSAAEITNIFLMANASDACIGVISWMHTFSPAKMWINGLKILQKPLVHLHTQFYAHIPYDSIDMDYMNLHQSAHGGREFGHMMTRMRKNRKVIVGHWKDDQVQQKIGNWSRVAAAWQCFQQLKVARLGDNMRQVAVTEGDKVEAQMRFGFSVNGYGIGDLAHHINQVKDSQVKSLINTYLKEYVVAPDVAKSTSLADAARIELGLRSFLSEGNFEAFTDTFEDLYGLRQLPGIAVQRLMADGYGFGAEGDWKTAALLRAMKVMEKGLEGGTSFMEDYTYDFGGHPSVLGSHMLEICPSIARSKPHCEIHQLGIGGKEPPARLIFDVDPGPAINVSLVDMGNRFRLLVNEVDAIKPDQELPLLPVARVLWQPRPSLEIAAQAWIQAGGAHHTVFSKSLTTEFIEDFAEMASIELVIIDGQTDMRSYMNQLRSNEVYYHLFHNNL